MCLRAHDDDDDFLSLSACTHYPSTRPPPKKKTKDGSPDAAEAGITLQG